jgi:signal transduction histidine kinase
MRYDTSKGTLHGDSANRRLDWPLSIVDNCGIMVGSDVSLTEMRARQARQFAAADAERRRIERALHDGVQQDLIAVAVRVQLARRLAATDLPAAMAVLDEVEGEVREALDRARALADGIYPSLLEAAGLAEALRSAASAVGVPAKVEATGLARHPADIEAAAYFCCRSALENVAAHAGSGARATIHLREEPDALRLEVVDDGTGFDPRVCPLGSGLTDARDRIEALGGVLAIESEPGRGTRIAATVPLYDASSAR